MPNPTPIAGAGAVSRPFRRRLNNNQAMAVKTPAPPKPTPTPMPAFSLLDRVLECGVPVEVALDVVIVTVAASFVVDDSSEVVAVRAMRDMGVNAKELAEGSAELSDEYVSFSTIELILVRVSCLILQQMLTWDPVWVHRSLSESRSVESAGLSLASR